MGTLVDPMAAEAAVDEEWRESGQGDRIALYPVRLEITPSETPGLVSGFVGGPHGRPRCCGQLRWDWGPRFPARNNSPTM